MQLTTNTGFQTNGSDLIHRYCAYCNGTKVSTTNFISTPYGEDLASLFQPKNIPINVNPILSDSTNVQTILGVGPNNHYNALIFSIVSPNNTTTNVSVTLEFQTDSGYAISNLTGCTVFCVGAGTPGLSGVNGGNGGGGGGIAYIDEYTFNVTTTLQLNNDYQNTGLSSTFVNGYVTLVGYNANSQNGGNTLTGYNQGFTGSITELNGNGGFSNGGTGGGTTASPGTNGFISTDLIILNLYLGGGGGSSAQFTYGGGGYGYGGVTSNDPTIYQGAAPNGLSGNGIDYGGFNNSFNNATNGYFYGGGGGGSFMQQYTGGNGTAGAIIVIYPSTITET